MENLGQSSSVRRREKAASCTSSDTDAAAGAALPDSAETASSVVSQNSETQSWASFGGDCQACDYDNTIYSLGRGMILTLQPIFELLF